jgi:hypothetical protein
MPILLVAEHDNKSLKDATAKALSAATAIGPEVHILVAGKDCRPAAEAAAKLAGVAKVVGLRQLLADERGKAGIAQGRHRRGRGRDGAMERCHGRYEMVPLERGRVPFGGENVPIRLPRNNPFDIRLLASARLSGCLRQPGNALCGR